MENHLIGNINVAVILGRFDDSKLDLVVKAQDILLDMAPLGAATQASSTREIGITIKEASDAENVIHWPTINPSNPNRRKEIYKAAIEALESAGEIKASKIGFFTMGLEVSRLPSWEIAEEIVKAINDYPNNESQIDNIVLVASSPTQVSSFHYAINNISIISEK